MIATIFTYPWDLHDEGVDRALGVITDVAGVNGVSLAVSYHISTYFLPHNPVRKLYYGEHGAVYFHPEEKHYNKTKIRPQVSHVVEGEDYLKEIVRKIKDRGLEFTTWIVYFYNHHLARTYPDCAKADVFGNPYLSQLCPANPDVRNYALALTEDIVSNYRPEAVVIESLSYLHFEYGFLNPKVYAEITQFCRFLMGICFCPHCLEAADRAGMDADGFQDKVADFLEENLPRNPTPDENKPISSELIDKAFGGDLKKYLDARGHTATSLLEEVARVVRSYGDIAIAMGMPSETSGRITGLRPEGASHLLNRVFTHPLDDPTKMREALAEWRRSLPAEVKILAQINPEHIKGREDLSARLKACRDAGYNGFTFYNYGLLRMEHLEWIGAAREVWA